MGIFLALLSAFFAFTWRITVRTKIKPGHNDLAFTALVDFFAALTAVLFIPIFGIRLPSNTNLLGIFLISVILSAVGDYLLVFATKNADTADTSILLPLSNIWVLLFAFVFLKEPLSFWKIISILMIVFGSIIAISQGKKIVFNKGIIVTFIYGFLITGTILIDKGISNNFSLPVYSAIFYFLSSGVLALLTGNHCLQKIVTEWNINRWWTVAIGAQWALFSSTLLFAYTREDASKAVPIMRVYIVLTTLYSVFVMKEKQRMWQKILGSIIVTTGVLVLAYLG
jgi:drug/metabolite transporter (DMT)-like permease